MHDLEKAMVLFCVVLLIGMGWLIGGAVSIDTRRRCVEQRTTFAKTASDSVTAYKTCLQPGGAK